MHLNRLLAGVSAALLGLALTGCTDDAVTAGAQRSLTIGIDADAPGFAELEGDELVGFDIDVARYVATALGWTAQEIDFAPLAPGDREESLQNGDVDLVVGTYRMTPERSRLVDFAGPYLTGKQDLLVTFDNAGITGPHSLEGRRLCSVRGSEDSALLTSDRFSPGARVVSRASLRECVEAVRDGDAGAVSADDVVLSGFVAEDPQELKVVESPFATHRYGIGLPQGSPDVAVINDLIAEWISSGNWRASYVEHLGDGGLPLPRPPSPGVG